MAITPYYLSLMDSRDPEDPIARQAVPLPQELLYPDCGADDPLSEEAFELVPGVTHRYPDRALMVITNSCAVHCRHCMRKRIQAPGGAPPTDLTRMIQAIAATPTIREVLVSGGDPLLYPTAALQELLTRLRAIPHLEIIRIGSRVPVTLPQRITPELCAMLEAFHPLWINVHFNHPRECTEEAAAACLLLTKAGIPLNNQSVLLRGVNDDAATMKTLVYRLMRMRVRPYYLFQCDPVRGVEHLRTPISKGIEIIDQLRGHVSGLAVPIYALDAPGGGGKVPVGPRYILSHDPEEGRVVFRNYRGEIYEYLEPRLPLEE